MTIDHEDLIAEAVRALASNQWTSEWGVESLAERLCDALEDATRLAQETTARLRETEREMQARELHHFEEEKLRAEAEARLLGAEACIEKARKHLELSLGASAQLSTTHYILTAYKRTTENGETR